MDRNCDKCIHHTSGMCDSWDCKMQTVEDVKKEAVKEYVEAVVAELEKLPQYRWGVTMHTAEDYVKVSDLRKVIEIAREEGEEHDDKLQESQ